MSKREQSLEIVADAIVKHTTAYYQRKLDELKERNLSYAELCKEMVRLFGNNEEVPR